MIYAGIGSRSTPHSVLRCMEDVAEWLALKGFVLRSGGARGADSAFERGCDKANGSKEIYLPWEGFEGNDSRLFALNSEAFRIAEEYHPYWHNLSQGAKMLQARNSHQVLGKDLKTPCDLIMCYTPNGDRSGGTGQALRIAEDYNIKIFDFGCYNQKKEYTEAFNSILSEIMK